VLEIWFGIGGSNPLSPTNLFNNIHTTSGLPVKKLIRAPRKLMTGDDLEDLRFSLVHSVLPSSKAGRIRVP
jgi:hypothetical protein